MAWKVTISKSAQKNAEKLPQRYADPLLTLLDELALTGPAQSAWPNYGKLKGQGRADKRHCHLKRRSRPTYVVCWEVFDCDEKGYQGEIYINYIGTHEKAPY